MTADELIQLQPALLRVAKGDEDVQQEANLKMWAKKETIRDPSHYAPRVACRVRWQEDRRSKAFVSMDSVDVEKHAVSSMESPVDILCHEEDRDRLMSAIRQLPSRQRAAISCRLKIWEAKILSPCSQSANNSASFKALRNLRRILQASL